MSYCTSKPHSNMETILSHLANGLQDPLLHSVSDWNPVLIIYWFLKIPFTSFSALWPFISYLEIIQELLRIWAIKPESCSPSLVMSSTIKRKITLERQMCTPTFYHKQQQLLSIILQTNVTRRKYFPTILENNSELPSMLKKHISRPNGWPIQTEKWDQYLAYLGL